jgi:AraC-like DNA-binding protein
MVMGASSLYNKLRALTGQNIVEFITSIRLKKACQILRDHPIFQLKNFQSEWDSILPNISPNVLKRHFMSCQMILP